MSNTDIPVEGELVPSIQGERVASAANVGTTGGTTVQSELDSVGAQVSIGFGWLWMNQVGGNPGSQHFAFNNAAPASTTALHLSQVSHSGRLDELLTRLKNNDFIFIQDTTNVSNSILYRVTAAPTLVSATFSYYTLPVEFVRLNGTYTPNADDRWAFTFYLEAVTGQRSQAGTWVFNTRSLNCTTPTTFATSLAGYTPMLGDAFIVATGGEPFLSATVEAAAGDIFIPLQNSPDLTNPAHWDIVRASTGLGLTTVEAHAVEQFSERDRRVNAADASAGGEAAFVRFWLRAELVVPGGESNPGTGLLIAEAQTGSFTQTSNDADAILYIGIDAAYITNTGTSNLVVEITDPDGNIDQRLNLDSDFEFDDELTGATPNIYHSTGASGGDFIRYQADQTIRVFRTTTDRHFQMTATPVVDLTQNIENLPESRLSQELQAKIGSTALTFVEQDKLDQWVADTTTSTPGALPTGTALYYKDNNPTNRLSDWGVTDVDTGIFGRFSGATNIYIAIDHRYNITSFTGIEGGTATLQETILPSPLQGFNTYIFRFPEESSATNFYLPNGTTITDAVYDATDRLKIGQRNFDDALAADYRRLHEGELTPALQDFEDKLSVSHSAALDWEPVTPSPLSSTVTRRWAAFFDENRTGDDAFSGNLFDDLANPDSFGAAPVYIVDGTDVRFPGQDSFSVGRVDAVGAATFGTSFQKLFAFRFYIENADWTGNVPVLKLGTRSILRAIRDDPTGEDPRNNVFVTVGNRDGTPINASSRQRLTAVNSASTIQYLEGVGANTTDWSVPSTLTFPLSVTFRMRVIDNGMSAEALTNVVYVIADSAIDQAQSTQTVTCNIPGNLTRNEDFTFQYTASSNTLTWGTTGLALNTSSDVTRVGSEATHDDTEDFETSTTTTNTGLNISVPVVQNEVRIVGILEAVDGQEFEADPFLQIVLIVNGHQENTLNLHFRPSEYGLDDWQFGPNSGEDMAVSEMQVYDYDFGDDPFRAPTHSQLYTLYTRQAQFLGLFVEPDRGFSQYTLNGNLVLTDNMGGTHNIISRFDEISTSSVLEVFQAVSVAAGSNSVTLPADWATFQYAHVVLATTSGGTSWIAPVFGTAFLNSSALDSSHQIATHGGANLRFNNTSGDFEVVGSGATMFRVALFKTIGGTD